jgi:hypothetical protein
MWLLETGRRGIRMPVGRGSIRVTAKWKLVLIAPIAERELQYRIPVTTREEPLIISLVAGS